MGYNAMTVADGDFLHLPLAVLRQREKEAKFPFLSANLILKDSGELLFKPYTIINIQRRNVAILGLSGSERQMPAETPGGEVMDLLDPIETARQYVPELRKQADIIIVLSHLGLEKDTRLAESVPGIDLIVGGRSRKILPQPLVVQSTGTIIVQAGYRGEWIGMVALEIDSQGTVTSHRGQVVPLRGDEYWDDQEMVDLVSKFEAEIGRE